MSAMTTAPSPYTRFEGWTVDDLRDLPEDGMRYELVDGCLEVSPPEATRNYWAAQQIVHLLRTLLPREWIALPGPGVGFDRRNYRQPDAVVIRRTLLDTDDDIVRPEDVLLAVEVMSPSSVTRDRVTKPTQYAAVGIPHFWRLEPKAPVLVTHALDGTTYRETGRFTGEVEIDQPVRLRFPLSDLLP